jgi:hypothetical protein
MKRALVIVAVVAATARADRAPTGAIAVIDRPVAVVDGAPIWQSQLDDQLAIVAHGKEADRNTIAAVLETMIDDELFISRLARAEISDAEIDAALVEIRKQNNINDAELDAALAQQHFTRARYRLELARQLRLLRAEQQELAPRVAVVEDDIKAAYAERKAADPTLGPIDSVREVLRSYVYAKKLEAARKDWLAERRKRARIERRSP